jgi:hypothetical protein
MNIIPNILWFLFGLVGLLLSFYMAISGNPKPAAVLDYIKQYPRIAIFNTFAYIFFIAMWWQDGIDGIMPKGHLTYWTVPLAWVAATFFHLVIKNFSTFLGGFLGKIFGVSDDSTKPPQ